MAVKGPGSEGARSLCKSRPNLEITRFGHLDRLLLKIKDTRVPCSG